MTDEPRFLSDSVRALPLFAGVPTADSIAPDPSGRAPALLHLNECPFPPSPGVVEAICRAASGVNRYGEPRPAALGATLASKTGIAADNIVIGNGSDEILGLVCQMALGPGDSAVMPTPSFPRYRIGARMMGAETRLVRILEDGRNDVAGLLKAIDRTTKVVFACTPNNPSGAALAAEEIRALVAGVPDDVLLVVDEAYYEFDVSGRRDRSARRVGPAARALAVDAHALEILCDRRHAGRVWPRRDTGRCGRPGKGEAQLQFEPPCRRGRTGGACRRAIFTGLHREGGRRAQPTGDGDRTPWIWHIAFPCQLRVLRLSCQRCSGNGRNGCRRRLRAGMA